jgi:hypothetical protein
MTVATVAVLDVILVVARHPADRARDRLVELAAIKRVMHVVVSDRAVYALNRDDGRTAGTVLAVRDVRDQVIERDRVDRLRHAVRIPQQYDPSESAHAPTTVCHRRYPVRFL